jgi:hypothetical protein
MDMGYRCLFRRPMPVRVRAQARIPALGEVKYLGLEMCVVR